MAEWLRIRLPMQETWVQPLGQEDPLEKEVAIPTPVFLPRKSHGQRSLEGYSPWSHRVRHDLAIKQQGTRGADQSLPHPTPLADLYTHTQQPKEPLRFPQEDISEGTGWAQECLENSLRMKTREGIKYPSYNSRNYYDF